MDSLEDYDAQERLECNFAVGAGRGNGERAGGAAESTVGDADGWHGTHERHDNGPGHGMNPCKGMDASKKMEMGEGKDTIKKPAAGPFKIVFGDKSAEWTPATLAALPHKTLTVCNVHVKANQTYMGVSLMELLARLGVPAMQHGKDLRLYLVAEGSDGYQAVYSLAEVNPELHDAAVIVADSVDGKPLADSGPLQLVAAGDKRPARWVRNLVTVRVLTAQ